MSLAYEARRAPVRLWRRWWMRRAGLEPWGRFATRMAELSVPGYLGRAPLASLAPQGYVASSAVVHHGACTLGRHVFVGDRCALYGHGPSDRITLGDRVRLTRDVVIETGDGGTVEIGDDVRVQTGCILAVFKGSIRVGQRVGLAAGCQLHGHNHGTRADLRIREQPLETRGGIVIEDDAWLGAGVIVLDGVRIGRGAVVGAGAVVVSDIPPDVVAVGNPARVLRARGAARPANVREETLSR